MSLGPHSGYIRGGFNNGSYCTPRSSYIFLWSLHIYTSTYTNSSCYIYTHMCRIQESARANSRYIYKLLQRVIRVSFVCMFVYFIYSNCRFICIHIRLYMYVKWRISPPTQLNSTNEDLIRLIGRCDRWKHTRRDIRFRKTIGPSDGVLISNSIQWWTREPPGEDIVSVILQRLKRHSTFPHPLILSLSLYFYMYIFI